MNLKARDKKHLWHPLKQHQTHPDSLAIVKAKGCYLYDEEGNSYKGAVDMFINDEITDEMREEYNKILDDFYYVFVRDIAEGRNWSAEQTEATIDNGPYLIPSKAVEAGLITATMYPDEFKDLESSFCLSVL